MDMGALVETLETSHTWARLNELHAAVGDAIQGALAGQGTPGLVLCHLSHAYADGASLYFPEFDVPETNNGMASGLDGDRWGSEYVYAALARDLTR